MRCFITGAVVFLMVCAIVLLNSKDSNAEIAQWIVTDGGNGHYYEVISVPKGITWTKADEAAKAMGGNLASITSAEENTFVYNLIPKNELYWVTANVALGSYAMGPWLGGYQYDKLDEPAGHWAWSDGELWDYTNWFFVDTPAFKSYEPNNGGGIEDYLGYMNIVLGENGFFPGDTWNDYRNDAPDVISFVVEFNSIPEPSGIVLLGICIVSVFSYYCWRCKTAA